MTRPCIPPNFGYTINWLLAQWNKAILECSDEWCERWGHFDEFAVDWKELGLADDSALTEDAKVVKRKLWELAEETDEMKI